MTRKKINILTVRAVQDFLREKNIQLFTPLDLERHFRVRTHTVLVFLVRNMKRGVYVQAKRGLYYDTQVVPGTFFGLEDHVRLSITPSAPDWTEALARISRAIRSRPTSTWRRLSSFQVLRTP